jgi:RNA-binding protein
MTSKQRAFLRGKANNLEAIIQIGKQGVTPEIIVSLNEALEARELVKVTVLPNFDEKTSVVAEMLAGRAKAECVQVIGKKIVLYRKSKNKPVIELPKGKGKDA